MHKGRILIVDDTPETLRLLMSMLGKNGYTVHPALGAQAALRFMQTVLPDLILLDVMMPEMDGYQLAEHLQADRHAQGIPIIFVSAAGQLLDKVRAFDCGAVDYIVKPFEEKELMMRIETHLSLRELRKRLEHRVAERTLELTAANERLREEIAERRQAEQALERSRREYEALVNSVNGIVWEREAQSSRFTFISQQAERLLGYPLRTWYDDPEAWTRRLHPDDARIVVDRCSQQTRAGKDHELEYRLIAVDGRVVWIHDTVRVIMEGDAPARLCGVMIDITERKHAEERITYMAHHDFLTGLPNRILIQDRINHAIVQARRDRKMVAVLFLDLDNFKQINDSLGHQAGDCILNMVADRLQGCHREGDSIARLGGDEFMLTLPDVSDQRDAVVVAQKVLDALNRPFILDGQELHVGGSIGISLFPADGNDAATLMRAADTAMYHAKREGRNNYRFFTQALDTAVQQRLSLEIQLRQAWEHGELTVHYQPQVDLRRGTIFSAEALLRWRKDGRPPISCAQFIAIAEETGLIVPIGEWVLREACSQLKHWRSNNHPDLRIAVNLSVRQFYQSSFQNRIARILDDAQLPADALELEITETMLMQSHEDILACLRRLNDMGVHLSVDDFGVGYSSLSYLQRLPVHALKIDRSFINGIGRDPNDAAIVSAIIALAESLRLNVIAEGVESPAQVAFLKEHGCQAGQGFYYSEPLPADRCSMLLQDFGAYAGCPR